MSKAIVLCDLGYGDCGKGTITDALVRQTGIRTVVRYNGGSQAAHNIVTPNGLHHTFSSWGSGTLAGALTVLTKDTVIDPVRLYNEGTVLVSKGVTDVWTQMIVDENALVITPYHRALNRIREAARGDARHGSCGIGVGETVQYALTNPDRALRMGDLRDLWCTEEKLRVIGDDLYAEALKIMNPSAPVGGEFDDPNLIDATLYRYYRWLLTHYDFIWKTEDVLSLIQSRDTIWEGAQGVLLDEDHGFHPYTTWSRSRPINATNMLEEAGVTDVTNIGIVRSYSCRHGPGPFPSEDTTAAKLLPEPYNGTNEWQRHFRVGWFDVPMTQYALDVAESIDYLAVTHVDVLDRRSLWPVIADYPDNPTLWGSHYAIDDFEGRTRFTESLMAMQERRVDMVASDMVVSYISRALGLPVAITSHGPRSDQKQYHGAIDKLSPTRVH